MMTYRWVEFGVERLENGRSTFIERNPGLASWREFEKWRALGNTPQAAPFRPSFPPAPIKRDLWIIGAGGYGREIHGLAQSCRGFDYEWRIAGFLNDIPETLDAYPELPRIQGTTDYDPQENDVFLCAIGDATGRRKVCEKFTAKGARFVQLVHPSATVSLSVKLGSGVIVEAYSGIGADAEIGDFSSILGHVSIGHDVKIGAYVQISPFASVLGRSQIGEGTLVGSHAVILPDVKVGAGATIGAGSVVIKDVADGATVFGVPANRIK